MTNQIGITRISTISADGYSASLNQTEERPFDDDPGDSLDATPYVWMFDIPEENRDEVDQMAAAEAFIVGRRDGSGTTTSLATMWTPPCWKCPPICRSPTPTAANSSTTSPAIALPGRPTARSPSS